MQLLVDVFAGLAEQRVGGVAQCEYAIFQLVEPQAALVDMVIKFLRGGGGFAVALRADHGKEIFFFLQDRSAGIVRDRPAWRRMPFFFALAANSVANFFELPVSVP